MDRKPHPFAARVERAEQSVRAFGRNLAARAEIDNSVALGISRGRTSAWWSEFFRRFGRGSAQ